MHVPRIVEVTAASARSFAVGVWIRSLVDAAWAAIAAQHKEKKLMKKGEAIKEAIEAWAASSTPETISRLGSNNAEAEKLRSDLSKKIMASIRARKKKSKSN